MLTETQIKKTKPKSKMVRLKDTAGLAIEIRPTGAKVFTKEYRFDGRHRKDTLGEFPEVSLAGARARALEINAAVKRGEDPRANDLRHIQKVRLLQAKVAEEEAAKEAVVPHERRFDVVAEAFIDKRALEGVAQSTLDKLNWNLGSLARGKFKGRDIGSIKPPEILGLIEAIQAEDKIEKAKDIHRKLSQVFDYAIGLGLVEWNPAQMTKRAVVRRKGGRHPGLTEAKDVGALMRAIRLYPDGSGQNTRAALLLSAYCFLRSNELRGAVWSEIDFEKATWSVPAERMKGHKGIHIVPLARQPLEILKALREWEGEDVDPDAYIFPMSFRGDRYMSEATLNAGLRRLGYNTRTQHCHHGFRTTFSTNMNEQGWNRDWIERQLCHTDKDDVRMAYNKALYLEGRSKMMQAYADWLDKVELENQKA
ncbi:tyrosine-type recombinase/integrase [Sulfitobacter pontiacus]